MEKSVLLPTSDPFVISIIELDFHYDCLDSLIKIFQDYVSKIHVFTTADNMRMLSEIQYNEHVVFHEYKRYSKLFFLIRNRSILKKSDLIFINTIATNFGAYLFVPNPQSTILRIHNINKQFVPFRSIVLPKNLYSAWKFASYFGREIFFKLFPVFRIAVNLRVRYFTFPDSGLTDYALLKGYVSRNKVIESIPFKVFSGSIRTTRLEDELVISVIGATDVSRRDYQNVIVALQEIYKFKSPNIKLVLLGKVKGAYGEWIIGELKKIRSKNFEVQYFRENVPENKFVEYLNQTHLVISPIVKETKTDVFREVYGKTKTSGSILDFIKFGCVTLTPCFYDPPREMKLFFQKYEDGRDLAKKLLYFYENPEILNELSKKSSIFVSENYNTDKIYNSCIDSLKSILNKK